MPITCHHQVLEVQAVAREVQERLRTRLEGREQDLEQAMATAAQLERQLDMVSEVRLQQLGWCPHK